jgi:hypothetical protein
MVKERKKERTNERKNKITGFPLFLCVLRALCGEAVLPPSCG